MSTNLAYATPLRRPNTDLVDDSYPRRVQIVTTRAQRRARPKLVYAGIAVVAIFGIFIAQLLLTIALSSGAYRITELQGQQQTLGRVTSSLNEKLDSLASPQNLLDNAQNLGMVSSPGQAFLRLSDGTVLGSATAAPSAAQAGSEQAAATGSVPNSLLASVPLIDPTISGHGDSNAGGSGITTTQSSVGSSATISVTASPPTSNPGELPSPVTH